MLHSSNLTKNFCHIRLSTRSFPWCLKVVQYNQHWSWGHEKSVQCYQAILARGLLDIKHLKDAYDQHLWACSCLTRDKITVSWKYMLDLLMMENGQSSGCFPHTTSTKDGQSGRSDSLKERDSIIYKDISSKEYFRGWRQGWRQLKSVKVELVWGARNTIKRIDYFAISSRTTSPWNMIWAWKFRAYKKTYWNMLLDIGNTVFQISNGEICLHESINLITDSENISSRQKNGKEKNADRPETSGMPHQVLSCTA